MSTLPSVELGVLGPLQVRQDGAPVSIPGAKPRAILTMLGLHNGSVVPAALLIGLLWGDDPPRTAAKALQTHVSSLRRTLGDGVVLTEGAGWILQVRWVDATRYKSAAKMGRDAAAAGDTSQAVVRFDEALGLWRGIPELPDGQRGLSEKTRWIEGHAALVEDRADALLATGRAAEVIGDLEAAVAEAPLRERRWGQLMLAHYRAGRQGDALAAYQRARSLLADELGVDPGPELRRLEAAIVAQDPSLDVLVAQDLPSVTRAVTFLLTDIEGSTAAWEADADAMAMALARHDELVEEVVTSRGGRLIKTRGEGDATFSVFDRPSAAAAAAIELQDAISQEPWVLREPMRIRVALHTGEVELRDGDYFGRAVNRVARLRSLAAGGQILCSGATAELVIDALPDDVALTDLGMRQLRNLARPEHVFELRMDTADVGSGPQVTDAPLARPVLPAVLIGPGPFVGRGRELEQLLLAWQSALAGGVSAVLIAGEPGVGKTRLAGEWSQQAYQQGAVVLYGRCDEDLGAPYQPFAEALRSLVPCVGASRLRGLRGVEALLPLVPGLTEVLPDLATPARADPDTERYALFDAVVALLDMASAAAPIVLILDDLHWAAKPTLLLLRHLLRFGDHAHVQIVGTYRSTDLDRSHPLAAMLADLHRDGTANRLNLSGLEEHDVTAYVAEAGYDDEDLAHALASVTGGNPFFLIEALRHVEESGGVWDQSTLPQGVREAVSRRLSRLPTETNKALAAAAVVGSRFELELVESVVGGDLVDAFDEACQAGIVIEEAGGYYRFNHAIVRQSLLAELASVRRMRLHQRIATTLESQPGADDELLAELAYHFFECAWAGNAAKAVEYCRRAADQATARLAYEGAAELYDRALHALEELDDELPDRDDQGAVLLIARCEALLAAGDVASAAGAVSQLRSATVDSARLAAWATCFDGQLSMLIHPERLDEVEAALATAASELAEFDDAAGEANAHTVRAACLARLGRIADGELALDDALTAARRAREHRRVNAVLAGAPLAALWGPNPVPRAGGRCLDVVRLLRITTDSPAVEATSTRCQAVLEAFRGRGAAARRMIESARRTVTELGLRHAQLEVEQFAGIVELMVDDSAAAEPHLRKAYNGFRRMGLDADTAETAALLGRTCLALNREAEADELCTESERLAGHALKASIAWRNLRAHLLARRGDHAEARRIAEAAVTLAERTDALVDHGDACLTLATVLSAAGNAAEARAAAERAVSLYERKDAVVLADRARLVLGKRDIPAAPPPPAPPSVELDNACVRVVRRLDDAVDRNAWGEVAQQLASEVCLESHRSVVGFPRVILSPSQWISDVVKSTRDLGGVWHGHEIIAVRGECVALARLEVHTADVSPGAPRDESLQLFAVDNDGRIALHTWFDIEDIDAATAELDAAHMRFDELRPSARRLENAASRVNERILSCFGARDWDALAGTLADDYCHDDRRRMVGAGVRPGRDAEIDDLRAIADIRDNMTADVIAIRGDRLVLMRTQFSGVDQQPQAFLVEVLAIAEINADEQMVAVIAFDPDDFDSAITELDNRYLAGEAAAHSQMWYAVSGAYAAINRREIPATTADFEDKDHRRGAAFASGDMVEYLRAGWDLDQDIHFYVEAVHRLSDLGAVVTHNGHGASREGFDAEWREVMLVTTAGDSFNRCEVFDETDVDNALARFEELQPQTPRLGNAACQVAELFISYFAARNWDALAETFAENFSSHDRRRLVGAGNRHGRDAEVEDLRAIADVGVTNVTSSPIATRGQRLVLTRGCLSFRYQGPEAFLTDSLAIVEIDTDERIVALVSFDSDDLDAAFKELDSRYLAGEAADHAQTWSVITGTFASMSRGELAAMTPDCATIDHRRVIAFAPGQLDAYIRAGWDQSIRTYAEVVHQLSDRGAVCTRAAHGLLHEGGQAEWREITVATVEGEMVNRCELFDETDLDAAIERFDELNRQPQQPENAASRAGQRFLACFAARDWDAMAQMLSDNFSTADCRRTVNAGVRAGRDASIEDFRAAADVGFTNITAAFLATRGERLTLARFRAAAATPDAFQRDELHVIEIDVDGRIAGAMLFDLDDFGAAIAELDARYLAGEAAPCADTWSAITRVYAVLNRREMPATTPDWVNIDHRRGTSIAPGEMPELLAAAWNLPSDLSNFIVRVDRLNELGAVVTHVANETSREGFHAEWRVISVLMLEGDMVNRCEVFDEAEIDAAIARFEQLSRPASRLENAASRVYDQLNAHFAERDWDAINEILSEDISTDDRRRVVNSGLRRGRGAVLTEISGFAEVGLRQVTSDVIATRGGRLVLSHAKSSTADRRPEAFGAEALHVVEIDDNAKIVAILAFDPDDVEHAIAELDARYVAGEAAPYARTWSVITQGYRSLNRHEVPATTPDLVSIDHRRVAAYAPGELIAYVRAGWDLDQHIITYVETVHRLNDLGAVATHAAHGKSREGFDAEWRGVDLLAVEGDMVSRSEVFDETDLAVAIERFEELLPTTRRLENAASRAADRVLAHFTAREWDAEAEMLAGDFSSDDRRRIVNAGVRSGRDAAMNDARANADIGAKEATSAVIATRGDRLVLRRARYSSSGQRLEAFYVDVLNVYEINDYGRMAAVVTFDIADIDPALEELDARYLAGEAAAHAHTWSVIARLYAGFNRHERPKTTPDWSYIDHRPLVAVTSDDLDAYIRAGWDLMPDISIRVEAVHRLNDLGVVVTHAAHGVTPRGFDAEWRMIDIFTVDGELISGCEMFDEADLDAAVARFEELQAQSRRLENAASRADEQIFACFAARNWDGIAEIVADDYYSDDRRLIINVGVRHGRDVAITNMQASAELGITFTTSDTIATRGERLVLSRVRWSWADQRAEAFHTEILNVAEINTNNQFVGRVLFDANDIDAAFEELDGRYLAGEAAPYARVWNLGAQIIGELNRHEAGPIIRRLAYADHRRVPFASGEEFGRGVEELWRLVPDARYRISAVHALDAHGDVSTLVIEGTDAHGSELQWSRIILFASEEPRVEVYEEDDVDAALARFEELRRQGRRLETRQAK